MNNKSMTRLGKNGLKSAPRLIVDLSHHDQFLNSEQFDEAVEGSGFHFYRDENAFVFQIKALEDISSIRNTRDK